MCLKDCIKFLVFAANFVFALVGIALGTLGIIYLLDINKLKDAFPTDFANIGVAPILTIVVGSIIFVISFLGCFGVCTGNSCMLTTYAVLLLVIFVAQVGIGIFAFLEIKDKDNLEVNINKTLDKVFADYEKKTHEVVDFMQTELKCCGTNGTSYWGNNVTMSCCEIPEHGDCSHYYDAPCTTALYDFITSSINIIGITVLSLSAVEVLSCIFALCLANSIRNSDRRGRY